MKLISIEKQVRRGFGQLLGCFQTSHFQVVHIKLKAVHLEYHLQKNKVVFCLIYLQLVHIVFFY